MGLSKLLFNDPAAFLMLAIPLLYSVIIHELAHGWVAWKMGDPTAKWAGRLTFNPIKHLDLIGTLALFLIGFGWAKPVPVNIGNIQNQRKGLLLVSSAGIVANIILAFIALFIYKLIGNDAPDIILTSIFILAKINIVLAAFNLIPIPPLDGSKILMSFTPPNVTNFLLRVEPYGFFIVLGLLIIGALNPVISAFQWVIISIISFFLPG